MEFAALHCHSSWSFNDSLNTPKKMAAKAKELNYKAIALTDHGNVAGTLNFQCECKKNGVKPIIGCEFYIVEDMKSKTAENKQKNEHITVYAKNQVGAKNLFRLSSLSFIEGFYYKPRIDYKTLSKYSEGLIVTSGCLKNRVCQAILNKCDFEDIYALVKRISNSVREYYLEIMPHNLPDQIIVNEGIQKIWEHTKIPVIVSLDSHYTCREEAEDQDFLMAISMRKDSDDEERPKLGTDTYSLLSAEEVYKLLKDHHKKLSDKFIKAAIKGTVDLSNSVEDNVIKTDQDLFPLYNKNMNDKQIKKFFNEMIDEGWKKKGFDSLPTEDKKVYNDRVDYEIDFIIRKGMMNYFLVVWDLIRFSREKGIPYGPGRGSVSASLVAYLLGITSIDPIKNKLLFNRFLSEKRCLDPLLKVFTNNGSKKLIDIKIGDEIISGDGRIVKVLEKINQESNGYIEMVVDGVKIRCSENHIWPVLRKGEKINVKASALQEEDRIFVVESKS